MNKVRILIIDDHSMFCAGIRALLTAQNNFEVVGEAADGLEGIQMATRLKPDVVISDLTMPNINGTEAVNIIKRRTPETRILVLTVHKAEEYIHMALKAGADGYILKDDSQDELINALSQILNGKSYLSPSICKNVVNGYLTQQTPDNQILPSWKELTQRELQVLKLVAEGNKNKQIAEKLSISHKTVEKHRSNFMRKLDLHDVSSIVTYAISNGIIIF